MSNFQRTFQKNNQIEVMRTALETAQQITARQLVTLAVSEAQYGAVDMKLVEAVSGRLMGEKFSTPEQLYNLATTLATEIIMEAAAPPAGPQSTPDTSAVDAGGSVRA